MKSKKWKLLNSKPVFESKWMTILSNDYQLPNGSLGKNYLHLDRPDYVLIVAFDKKNRIIVEKNYRRGVNDLVYELPAGWIEKGETPGNAVLRELKEEVGYAGDVKKVSEVYPQPAFSSMKAYVVLIEIRTNMKTDQQLSHDENIDYELISVKSINKMVLDKKIKDMGFMTGLWVFNSFTN